MEKIRVRFAPSPTGPLHIGGARSALFNYLFAKSQGGDFILRMEDTDRERSSLESEENIKASLRWLGMDWNEGVDVGGPYAPYRQTERLETYNQAARRLLEGGWAYYCYCSEEELEDQRQQLIKRGETPRYLGNCRNLSPGRAHEYEEEGRKPVIRFKVPEDVSLTLSDRVRGQVTFNSDEIGGDFVIVKSDGIPTYNFAVVVDDHLMKITHILRGEEHLSNTPRQLLLYQALDWPLPAFAHVSLILGEDRSKMSKRHGSVAVMNYKEAGYLPQALVNFLALLGWSPEGEEEFFTMKELEQAFSLERVSKSPAVFDMVKLRWINSHYLRALPIEELAEAIAPFAGEGWQGENLLLLAETLANHLEVFGDVQRFLPLVEGEHLPPLDEESAAIMAEPQVEGLIALFAAKIEPMEQFNPAEVKAVIKACGKELGLKGKQLFMPLRIALTGSRHGPDIDKLAVLMGRETLLARLKTNGKGENHEHSHL